MTVKTHSLAKLRKICKELNLLITGTKPVLFKRLRDSGREAIELVDDDTLRYRRPVDGEAPDLTLPQWVLLNPDPVADIDGIDMLRGAQHGFFGPTNIENAVGAPSISTSAERRRRFVVRNLRRRRIQGIQFPRLATCPSMQGTFSPSSFETVGQSNSSTRKYLTTLSNGVSSTRGMHKLRQREPVLEEWFTTTMSLLMLRRSTR